MHDHRGERRAAVRAAIQAHLSRFPFAGDTRDGIVANWLVGACQDDPSDIVESVLAEMVADGLLQRSPLPGGGFLYVGGPKLGQR